MSPRVRCFPSNATVTFRVQTLRPLMTPAVLNGETWFIQPNSWVICAG